MGTVPGSTRVVYVPDGTETAVAAAPSSQLPAPSSQLPVCPRAARRDRRAQCRTAPLAPGERRGLARVLGGSRLGDMSPLQQQLVRYMERDLPHLDELRALAHDLWLSGAGVVIGGYADYEVINSIAEQTLAGREKAGAIPAISATTTGPTPTLPSAARWRRRSGAPAWCGTTACATGNKRTLPGGLM